MAYQIRINAAAETELDEAIAWYEEQKQGVTFLNSFYEIMSILEKRPALFPVIHKNFRRALIRRFLYAVFYAIEESAEQVVILSVWHTSQDPERLKNKLGY
ncbi:MAG TPA: type II toxin-antitoxin system RelE/ParE family toxin [Adhaeribacter sp.]|nr:type II toxin-antitoxin system RelE/ParE family toxin [Adhaeribacter sp.]